MPTSSKDEVEKAAQTLLDRGVKQGVLVKRGGSGSLLVTREGSTEQGIFEAKKVGFCSSSLVCCTYKLYSIKGTLLDSGARW